MDGAAEARTQLGKSASGQRMRVALCPTTTKRAKMAEGATRPAAAWGGRGTSNAGIEEGEMRQFTNPLCDGKMT